MDLWGEGHGYWMRKVRVVEARIFDGIAGFERGVERFCKVGSSGFWLGGGRFCRSVRVVLGWR